MAPLVLTKPRSRSSCDRCGVFALRDGTALFISSFEYIKFEEAPFVEDSVQIACDYLELTGEIDDGLSAGRFLLRHIEKQFAEGVRSRLLLSNRAIMAYQQLRREQHAA